MVASAPTCFAAYSTCKPAHPHASHSADCCGRCEPDGATRLSLLSSVGCEFAAHTMIEWCCCCSASGDFCGLVVSRGPCLMDVTRCIISLRFTEPFAVVLVLVEKWRTCDCFVYVLR